MEGTKACTKCGEVKLFSEFVRKACAKSGYASHCLVCNRKRKKKYRQEGKENASCRNNPMTKQLASMIVRSRKTAKEKGLDHDIDVGYLRTIIPAQCPYLGVKLRWKSQMGLGVKGQAYPDSPSLDRIDSSKGYVKGNVVIASHRANSIKNNANEQELLRIGRALSLLKAELAFPG